MKKPTIPAEGSRSHALLIALKQGPGTFYQVCERACIDIEAPGAETPLRHLFDFMIGGNVRLCGIMYHLTDDARLALDEARPAPYIGQVAGPAYRGFSYGGPAPVTIARRAAGART